MEAPSSSEQGVLAIYAVAFSLAFGPFFNGMFYEPIRLVGVALLCSAGALALFRSHEHPLHRTDLLPVLFFGAYAVASATAIFPRGQLSALLDLAAFLAVYATIRTHVQHSRILARILVVAGACMAAVAISRLYGVTFWDRFVVDLVIGGRLSGGFQYANTFAAWLGVLWFLSMAEARRSRIGSIYLVLGGLFAGAFMLTQSRGALLALPVALLFALLVARPGDRLFLALSGPLTWVLAFFLGNMAVVTARAYPDRSILFLLACLVPPLAAPLLYNAFTLFARTGRPMRIALVSISAVALAITLVRAAPRLLALLAPLLEQISATRVGRGFTLTSSGVLSRLVFSYDAWRIMEDLHFLGAGGRSWQRLYLGLRTYPYFTTEVHNHYLQVGVEAGLLGLIAFIAMIGILLLRAWKARGAQPAGDLTLPGWSGAVVFIAVHSLYDFDLSYLSLLAVLAAGLGVLAGHSDSDPALPERPARWWLRGVLGVSLLAFVVSAALLASWWARMDSDRAWAAGRPAEAVARMRLARWTDPLHPEVWMRWAALQQATGEGEAAREAFVAALQRALALDPYTPATHVQLADVDFAEGRWDAGFERVLRAHQLHPLDQGLIEQVANLAWHGATARLKFGERERALDTARRIVPVEAQLEADLSRIAALGVRAPYPYGYTPFAHLRMGQTLLVAGDFEGAERHLREAQKDKNVADEATQWLSVALELSGQTAEAEQLRSARPDLFAAFLEDETYQAVRAAAAHPSSRP